MRPRVFPAEDRLDTVPAATPPPGFNEAAGIPRGRPNGWGCCSKAPESFNEAAGIPRGRPRSLGGLGSDRRPASMRPRVFPAEDRDVPVQIIIDYLLQ